MSRDGDVLAWSLKVHGVAQLRARDMTSGKEIALPPSPRRSRNRVTLSADKAACHEHSFHGGTMIVAGAVSAL